MSDGQQVPCKQTFPKMLLDGVRHLSERGLQLREEPAKGFFLGKGPSAVAATWVVCVGEVEANSSMLQSQEGRDCIYTFNRNRSVCEPGKGHNGGPGGGQPHRQRGTRHGNDLACEGRIPSRLKYAVIVVRDGGELVGIPDSGAQKPRLRVSNTMRPLVRKN